jgi:GAF domain-containing protein
VTDRSGTTQPVDPVLHAILRAAVESTGATDGWLAAVDDAADQLVVVVTVGGNARRLLGVTVNEDEGFTGFVVGSGHALAIEPSADDPRFADGLAPRLGHRPRTLLCVPCEDDDVVLGAIELVDKITGAFSYDDLELVTVLAGIAGVALRLGGGGAALIPTPVELGDQLEDLAAADPLRYAQVAELVATLARRV